MKRLCLLSASILCGALSSSVFANQFTCKPMQWEDVTNEDKIYTFKVTNDCTLTADKPLKVAEIKDAFEKFFTKSREFRIKSKQTVQQNSTMAGKILTVHEDRVTKHGNLDIEGKIYLLDDGNAKFRFDYTSDEVNGDGNAKYTRYEKLELDLTAVKAANTYQLKFKQTDEVRKPSLAPKGMFIRKAKEGIQEDLGLTSEEQAKILLGM